MNAGFLTLTSRIGDFLDVTQDGYAIYSAEDILIGCNRAYADILYISHDQVIGKSFNQLFRIIYQENKGPKIDSDDIEQWLILANSKRRTRDFRLFEVDLVDGRWFLMSEQTLPSGEILLQAKNITKQKVLEHTLYEHSHQLSSLASTDDLTRISNRRSFIAQVNSELSRSARKQLALTFCLLDIDHFKKINDRYGHQAGDAVLSELAGIVQGTLRKYDLFGRIGGEEFGILLPDTGSETGLEIMQRLRIDVMHHHFKVAGHCIQISVSIGVVSGRSNCKFEQLYNDADVALYQAKNQGRNRVIQQNSLLS